MTEELEKLIKNAPNINAENGEFESFLIVPTNELYDGLGGAGRYGMYNNILIFGKLYGNDDVWYKLCDHADIFCVRHIYEQQNCMFNLDIPTEYGVPRIWFRTPIKINNLDAYPSAIVGSAKKGGDI